MARAAWRFALPPAPTDPRYRVLERRDVREAVRFEVPLVVLMVAAQLVVMWLAGAVSDLVAVVALVALGLLAWGPGSLVRRRPYLAAVSVGGIILTIVGVFLIATPKDSPLLLGDYAIIVVGAALLVTFNERTHRFWVAVAIVPLLLGLSLGALSQTMRLYGLLIGAAAAATSVVGNSLVQRRRERTWAQETLLRRQRRDLREAVARLEAAQATIATLEGVLPICAHCKRIRDADEAWVRIETYVEQRSAAQFTHGICPECAARHYGHLGLE
jgi:hypothetical protein